MDGWTDITDPQGKYSDQISQSELVNFWNPEILKLVVMCIFIASIYVNKALIKHASILICNETKSFEIKMFISL